jgi:hypothetical protein
MAITAIIYFLLIKGAKGSSFITDSQVKMDRGQYRGNHINLHGAMVNPHSDFNVVEKN